MAQRPTHPAAQPTNNEHATQAATSTNGERDRNGRFAAGNRGGPGNPFARQVAELRKAFVTTVTPNDMQRICQRLITQAVLGDTPSIKILLGYVLGKFPEPAHPDAVDHDEIRLHVRNLAMDELHRVAKVHMPPRVSLAFLRGMSVVHEENAARMLLKDDDRAAAPATAASGGAEQGASAAASEAAAAGDGLELADAFAALSAALPAGAPDEPPSPNGASNAPARNRKPSPFWRQGLLDSGFRVGKRA